MIKSIAATAGGAERVLRDVAGGLAERGHDISVLSFDSRDTAAFYAYNPLVAQVRLGVGDTEQATSRTEAARRVAVLHSSLRRHRPDVAVGFMHSSYVPLALAAIATRVPVVASEHNAAPNYADVPLQLALLSGVQPLVHSTTVLSSKVADGFPRPVRRKAVIVPNPVFLPSMVADLAREAPRRRLLAVGSLTEQKDHATLLQAYRLLADRFSNWDLRIVGEGPLRADLEAFIGAHGLKERVALPGATERIHQEYRDADLFVVPSRYEGFGLVTAEALGHGLPCVGFSDCPGTDELIEDGRNGLLVDGSSGRAAALANGLAHLMADAKKRITLGMRGPSSVQRFSPTAVIDQWEQLLASC